MSFHVLSNPCPINHTANKKDFLNNEIQLINICLNFQLTRTYKGSIPPTRGYVTNIPDDLLGNHNPGTHHRRPRGYLSRIPWILGKITFLSNVPSGYHENINRGFPFPSPPWCGIPFAVITQLRHFPLETQNIRFFIHHCIAATGTGFQLLTKAFFNQKPRGFITPRQLILFSSLLPFGHLPSAGRHDSRKILNAL